MSTHGERRGGVILCGGKSSRMGQDKAQLPFGDQTLLGRTVRLASLAIPLENLVCVAAAGQRLPSLPGGVVVVRDPQPGLGPLAAVGWGLEAAARTCDAALVIGCDYPLLTTPFVELLFASLAEGDCVAGQVGGRVHPLPAVMRVGLADAARSLLASGESSLRSLLTVRQCRWLQEDELRRADPLLQSLVNCNDDAAYQRALGLAGCRCDTN